MTTLLQAGDFVTPAVKLLRPLAEGGMGRVWVAEHLGLHSEVVVKLMADEMSARSDGAERFGREAAAAAAIKSPHVVQVFDHGRTDAGVPYIVMELLEGEDLGAYLTAHGRMAPLDVVTLVVQTSKALSKAHRASIVHRDIKPDNIFLCDTEGGEIFVKLLDFGTVKRDVGTEGSAEPRISHATAPGMIMGTPHYMSPEQSVGAPSIDERSDIWSLGVVAFEALTGHKPFDGASVGAITIAIHGPLPRMTELVPELPTALDEWFSRACAQDPQDRFASAREMASALSVAVTGIAPVDQPTESVFFPAPTKSTSTPAGPVTRPIGSLVASLPARGSERKVTTIAAGVVLSAAAAAMVAIVFSRSPAERPSGVETSLASSKAEALPPASSPLAALTPSAPVTGSAPTAVDVPPYEPEPTIAQAPRPAPRRVTPPAASKPVRASGARDSHAGSVPLRRGRHDDAGVLGHEDDDLVRLSKAAAQHVDPPPATPREQASGRKDQEAGARDENVQHSE